MCCTLTSLWNTTYEAGVFLSTLFTTVLGSLFSAACPGLGLAGTSSLALGRPWSAVATSLSAATLALKDGDAASYAIFSIGGLSLLALPSSRFLGAGFEAASAWPSASWPSGAFPARAPESRWGISLGLE